MSRRLALLTSAAASATGSSSSSLHRGSATAIRLYTKPSSFVSSESAPSSSRLPVPTPHPALLPSSPDSLLNSTLTATAEGEEEHIPVRGHRPRPNTLPGVVPVEEKRAISPISARVALTIAPFFLSRITRSKAIRQTRFMVGECMESVERSQEFWYDKLMLPDTYQAFFATHLIHILIISARLRALEKNDAYHYEKEFTEHFFQLCQVRLRKTMGINAPERKISRYMKDLGDQWRGYKASFALGLASSDASLADTIWRNTLGGRGSGAKLPIPKKLWTGNLAKVEFQPGPKGEKNVYGELDVDGRIGGEGRVGPIPTSLISPPTLDAIPDGWESLELVPQLASLVGWVRREIWRLDQISDADILAGRIGYFGPIEEEEIDEWNAFLMEELQHEQHLPELAAATVPHPKMGKSAWLPAFKTPAEVLGEIDSAEILRGLPGGHRLNNQIIGKSGTSTKSVEGSIGGNRTQ